MRLTDSSAFGPPLPTCAVHKVVSFLGYTGRGANAFGKATRDPKPSCAAIAQLIVGRRPEQRGLGKRAPALLTAIGIATPMHSTPHREPPAHQRPTTIP